MWDILYERSLLVFKYDKFVRSIDHCKLQFVISGVQLSNNGKVCKNKCQKDGQSYNWCWIASQDPDLPGWDYCTPSKKYNNCYSTKLKQSGYFK